MPKDKDKKPEKFSLFPSYNLRSSKNKSPSLNSLDKFDLSNNIAEQVKVIKEFFTENENENSITMAEEQSSSTQSGTNYRLSLRDVTSLIGPFDGSKEKYRMFAHSCENAIKFAEKNRIPVENILIHILNVLGQLGCEFVVSHSFANWAELKKICDQHFDSDLDKSVILGKLYSVRQDNLSVFAYYSKIATILNEYNLMLREEYILDDNKYRIAVKNGEDMALQAFEKGLRSDIRKSLVFQKPKNLLEIYELARTFEKKETQTRAIDENDITQKFAKFLLQQKDEVAPSPSFDSPQIRQVTPVVCQYCNRNGHTASNCYQLNNNNNNNNYNNNRTCQICHRRGHTADICYSRNNNANNNRSFPRRNNNGYNNNNNNSGNSRQNNGNRNNNNNGSSSSNQFQPPNQNNSSNNNGR